MALPQALGLRIPPVLPNYTTPLAQPRYVFCLATRTISAGRTRLLGIRQYLTLGVDTNYGTPPERPIELPVRTPSFQFPDGNVSWHVVTESVGRRSTTMKSTDAAGWQYLSTDGSAMLYSTFTNSIVTPTGAPVYYFQGLTAYTAPELSQSWQDIGGLGNIHDMRFPWYGREWGSIDSTIEGTTRISLYATVLQTNPATRTALVPPNPWLSSSTTPEELFVYDWTKSVGEVAVGPIYWRIGGALVFEDGSDVREAPLHLGPPVPRGIV